MSFTGVYPVYNSTLKINKSGVSGLDVDMVQVADIESISMKIDGKTENWTPMDTAGWERVLMTGKALSFTCKGKRNIGDPGNDYIHECAWADGLDCSSRAELDFPDGGKLNFNCVVDVSNDGGDDSTKVAPLEFDLKCDGKPIYTAGTETAALALSNSTPADGASNVAINATPTLTFNNKLEEYGVTLINAATLDVVAVTSALDGTGKILTITPTAALTGSTHYAIVLASAKDVYGHVLSNTVIDFTTAA